MMHPAIKVAGAVVVLGAGYWGAIKAALLTGRKPPNWLLWPAAKLAPLFEESDERDRGGLR